MKRGFKNKTPLSRNWYTITWSKHVKSYLYEIKVDMDIETLLSITSDTPGELRAALLEMLDEADRYFGNRDSTIAWLTKPNVAFKFCTPASVCDDTEGVKLVMEQINRLKFGYLA